MTLTPC